MGTKIPGVAVCIWDFDGTLYRSQQALKDQIRASEIRVIMDHTGWTQEQATEKFYLVFNVVTPSGTKATSMLAHIPNDQASLECSRYTDYIPYLHADPKLSALFAGLTGYSHYMLVNGTQASVRKGLGLLGVNPSVFREIVTSEIVGETKPGDKGFRYIMHKTGLPAEAHLMIGDREAVDLAPAKALGMRTCLVWSAEHSRVADVSIPTVYEVANMLG